MSDQLRAYALLTVVSSCWALNTILAKLAVGEISPMSLTSLRWLLALGLLCAFAFPSLRRDWPVLRRHIGLLLCLGAVGFATFNSLLYMSAHYTSALNIAILQGAIPVFVLLGIAATPGGKLAPMQMLGVAVTLAGVIAVATQGDPRALATMSLNLGDMLILGACMIYAAYTLWLRNRPAVSPLSQFAVMAAGAWIASWLLLGVELRVSAVMPPTSVGWLIALVTAVFPSLLAQVWFIRGVELLGPARAGIFVNLVPALAALLAVVVLGESFGVHHPLGLALVLGGITLSERSSTTVGRD